MAGRTIVIVEDEQTIAAAVAARLGAEGFRVETAGDGPAGVELCRQRVTGHNMTNAGSSRWSQISGPH